MAIKLVALVLLVVSAASCGRARRIGPADPGTSPARLQAGDYDVAVRHEGRGRSYLVHIPATAASGQPVPVLLAFHGGGGNPSQFKRSAGIDRVSDREGFVVVYPAGTGVGGLLLTWNAGSACCGRALALGTDDVAFTRAVLDDLSRRVSVDRSRVYATGHSNGAGMTYRLATEAPELVAAIAPVAGASMGIDRRNARPVPLLHIHSRDDPRALYDGGLGPPFPGSDNRVQHRSVQEELAFWSDLNGCATEVAVEETRISASFEEQRADRLVFSCRPGFPLEHWRLDGVGHGGPELREE